MDLVKLTIKEVSYSLTHSGYFVLILKEEKGTRNLPIIIGSNEAESIDIGMNKELEPARPMTHSLLKNCFNRFGIIVKQVIIHKFVDGIFYSGLICERDKIEEIIDARPSDAIALAIRFNAPIFTYENILRQAGYISNEEEGAKSIPLERYYEGNTFTEKKNITEEMDIKDFSIIELKNLLKRLLKKEKYELAAKVRDELTSREKNK